MISRRWCALVAAFVVGPAGLQAQAEKKPDLSANAALQYWQAFAVLPEWEGEQEKAIEAWKSGPPPAKVQELLGADKPAIRAMHRGAKLPHCDWGLHYEDGPGLLLPQLHKSRILTRHACLGARAHFEQSHPNEAIDDLLATLAFARHAGSEGTMISLLVQFANEAIVIETAAPYLPALKRETLRRLEKGLAALPPGGNIKSTFRTEREHMLGWYVKQVKANVAAEIMDKILAPDTSFSELLKKAGGRDGVIKQLQEVEPFYDEMDKIASLPFDQQQAQLAAFQTKVAANPFAKMLLPAIGKMLQADAKARTRFALFKAALAVAQHGPERLKDHPDPAGKGPFEYQKLPQGFELKSKLIDRDQPVTLRVGAK